MTIGGVGGATRRMLYSTGTTTRVKHVATSSPPITARPSGAFCSPPSPRPNAIGSIPMIMASAVMQIGRSRSEEHTSELQSRPHLVCRLLLEKKKKNEQPIFHPSP